MSKRVKKEIICSLVVFSQKINTACNRKLHQIEPENVETFKNFRFLSFFTQHMWNVREISLIRNSIMFGKKTSYAVRLFVEDHAAFCFKKVSE